MGLWNAWGTGSSHLWVSVQASPIVCVCVCVCVCVSVCGCGCVWVWVCVECLGTGSSHLWFSVQVSPMAHTCVLCVCESEIVCVCVNLKSDQACGWQAGFERRAEGSY